MPNRTSGKNRRISEPPGAAVRHVTVEAQADITFLPDSGSNRLDSIDDLERLFVSHRSKMVRLAHLLTGSLATAEEVVQESFIKVFEKRASVDNPGAYLHRTVVNGCHSRTRRRKNEAAKFDVIRHRREVETATPPSEAPEIWNSLDALSSRQRTAIVLRFYNDLTTAETAAAMGVRPGTVKSLVHRGLDVLRKEMRHD